MTTASIVLLNRADGGALEAGPVAETLSVGDPFAAGRKIMWTGPADMAAGRVSFAGTAEAADFPHTETIVVVAGRLSLSVDGAAARDLLPGAGAVLARGTALRLEAAPGTSWVFCATTGEASVAPGVTELSAQATLSPSSPPAAELLEGPVPQCRSFNAFTDEAARVRAGTWDSTPYKRILRPHPVNELMHILAGSVGLTEADGKTVHVGEGDSVFVPQGASCAWESRVHVAKFYVVQQA